MKKVNALPKLYNLIGFVCEIDFFHIILKENVVAFFCFHYLQYSQQKDQLYLYDTQIVISMELIFVSHRMVFRQLLANESNLMSIVSYA